MEALHVQQTIVENGRILIEDVPYQNGQVVEIIVLSQSAATEQRPYLTVGQMRKSGLIGLWEDRDDIQDSIT